MSNYTFVEIGAKNIIDQHYIAQGNVNLKQNNHINSSINPIGKHQSNISIKIEKRNNNIPSQGNKSKKSDDYEELDIEMKK